MKICERDPGVFRASFQLFAYDYFAFKTWQIALFYFFSPYGIIASQSFIKRNKTKKGRPRDQWSSPGYECLDFNSCRELYGFSCKSAVKSQAVLHAFLFCLLVNFPKLNAAGKRDCSRHRGICPIGSVDYLPFRQRQCRTLNDQWLGYSFQLGHVGGDTWSKHKWPGMLKQEIFSRVLL